jgi:hypothetical protein
MKDTSVIPYGGYCYTRHDVEGPIEKPTAVEEALFKIIPGYRGLSEITPCPFWSAEPSGRAHCSFLGIDSEPYPDDPFIKGGLIWDQVKECGVNPWRPDGPKE